MSDEEVGLGRRLQAARNEAGITQQELCQKAGLSYSTLAKIERGAIKSPSIFTIEQIARVLNTSLDALVGFSNTTSSDNPKKRSKSGVSFVFLDVNGCLVRFFHRAFTRIAEDTELAPDVIETVFWHYNDAVCSGAMKVDEFNQTLAAKLGVKTFDWQKYYLEAIDPITEMQNLASWLADNYQVGLLTNIPDGFIDMMRGKGVLPDVNYSAIIDSSKEGVIKPDPKIYEIAQKAAGCLADEILLVDDSRTNLMAAERLGWHVMWFDDFNPSESVKRIRTVMEPSD
ncbi:MAG TPA: HAD-IA family hydrolase [Candidatus Saccharimonadales bacterium]|nr:HAD-IA family hydrolase [Candidatus Saccharimonadales bacterium]